MKTQKQIRILLFVIAGVLVVWVFFYSKGEVEEIHTPTVAIEEVVYEVKIADSFSERVRGLSGLKSLQENEGMLFIFKDSEVQNFWMKDMFFPIDIIWIDENLEIVNITENASPESYKKENPDTFSSEVPVKYVLEVNAFQTKQREILLGEKVELFVD